MRYPIRIATVALSLAWALAGCTSDETSADDDDDGGGGTSHGGQAGQGGVAAQGGQGGGAATGGQGGSGGQQAACPPGTKDGPVEGAEGERAPGYHTYNVRTPDGYDPTVAHPLLVVYAPAGGDENLTETFTGLTAPATARGYIVVYVDHVSPATREDVEEVGAVPELVAARWCVDPERLYLTGHSDGGSVASLLGLWEITNPPIAAMAPSAAGMTGSYLAAQDCPSVPLPVMVLHSTGDTLFPPPEFGEQPADWWAACASCGDRGAELPDGCEPYESCTPGVEVRYCEGTRAHGYWPRLNDSMLDFFDLFPSD